MPKKIITSSFFTTTNKYSFRDVWKYIFKFGKKNYVSKVEKTMADYLDIQKTNIVSFYNARSALYHGLKLLWLQEGDEVIIQAYTCVSVPNSIVNAGIKPVYVDVDQSLNMDPNLIKAKITDKTKAIMVQHTFGNPADLDAIKKICEQHNLYLIEDCAHSLWAEYKWKKVWTFGDISFFSLGRDKVISSVNGWILIINHPQLIDAKSKIEAELKNVPKKLVRKNMFYLLVSYLSYKTYSFFELGKVIIYLARRWKLIPEILSKKEKSCHDTTFFYKFPNALAYVILGELERLDKYNKKRIQIAKNYRSRLIVDSEQWTVSVWVDSKMIFLRYPLFVVNPEERMRKAKQNNILLGNRYQQIIAPEKVDYAKAMYIQWSCPNAEMLASRTINLPCHPNLTSKDVEKVIEFITLMWIELDTNPPWVPHLAPQSYAG